ncbi:MAG: hypothetical protein Q8Q08_09190 [Candidatus Omnitrophota bacterium]|nr:hypothetical protein [Candidatus Omnitrophota bacterium]MDZ4242696.1 hypothetical protein [Candidatus Omnitrophota bacterium]
MIFYVFAKILQAAGLVVILINFLTHFPNLMDMKVLAFGAAVFAAGWTIQRYGVRHG